jgi:hypothetical protein
MFLQKGGGGDVIIKQTHPWQLWDQIHQMTFMGVEYKLVTWGCQEMVAPPHILHNITCMPLTLGAKNVPSSQPKVQVIAKA